MEINKLSGGLSGLLLCLLSSSAAAYDGILNFEGEAVQSTCVFEGISSDGASPSLNPVIKLPDISAEALAQGESVGKTVFYFHFRDCVYMPGHEDFSATFHTQNVSSDRALYMPDNTPDSAKNVGFEIIEGYRSKAPNSSNRGLDEGSKFPTEKGDMISGIFSVAYKKVAGNSVVVPGKMSATITYEMVYF
ncbi:type 1 fimbrial protein [Klebsiella huaxiensis]|uniref:fimbrial protein n=1 Tax=Klebsiella huaxiensis TaxID=2153354 RepID=UPI002F2BED4C